MAVGCWFEKAGRRSPDEKNWFLFKEKDKFAKPDSDIEADEPLSVTTGRDLEEIAADSDRVWGPKGEIKKRKQSVKKRAAKLAARPSANGKPKKIKVPKPLG